MQLEIDIKLTQGDFCLKTNTVITEDTLGIFGHSGAGKSTLLHVISGLKKPQYGRITLNGTVLFDSVKKIFLPPEKRNIGVVFQEGKLFPHMTVKKNLLFGVKKKSAPDFDTIVNVLELRELLIRYPHNLSGGEKQRVAIGRALLCNPQMLLLDEPFSAIDYNMRNELLPFINLLRAEFNIPIIIISHDLPDILHFTDYLLLLKHGEIFAQGYCRDLAFNDECSQLITKSGIRSCFNARIINCDKHNGTTTIQPISKNTPVNITVPYSENITTGAIVRAQISPEDIILSAAPAEYISAQNQIKGIISRIHKSGTRAIIEINANGLKLISEVTNKAAEEFPYHIGAKVWMLFKTHALTCARHGSTTLVDSEHTAQVYETSKQNCDISHTNHQETTLSI